MILWKKETNLLITPRISCVGLKKIHCMWVVDPKWYYMGCRRNLNYMSHSMRKPVYTICEQQRCRSACASAQSDQRLCCWLPGLYNTSTCCSRKFKNLASLLSWPGWFVSYRVANPEDRFSRDVAHTFADAGVKRKLNYIEISLFKHVRKQWKDFQGVPQSNIAALLWCQDENIVKILKIRTQKILF